MLGVARIDHGNRSLEDPKPGRPAGAGENPLTVCPLSNLRLRVVDDLDKASAAPDDGKGLIVTVNSDDPAYFGGYVNQNYCAVSDALGLDRNEIVTIVRNGIEASLMTPSEKNGQLRRSTASSPRFNEPQRKVARSERFELLF